jgi:hypothetical protein
MQHSAPRAAERPRAPDVTAHISALCDACAVLKGIIVGARCGGARPLPPPGRSDRVPGLQAPQFWTSPRFLTRWV